MPRYAPRIRPSSWIVSFRSSTVCEATSEIRRRQVAPLHTPIIAVTASRDGARPTALPRRGAWNDYLTKPLTLKALAAVLSNWIPNGELLTFSDDGQVVDSRLPNRRADDTAAHNSMPTSSGGLRAPRGGGG